MILFEMITGQPPYQGDTPFAVLEQHRSAAVPDLQALCPVPGALAGLVERLLAKEPERRPEDGELQQALRLCAGAGPDQNIRSSAT